MTAVTRIEPNLEFSHPASAEHLAKAVAAPEGNGFEVVVVENADEARERVLAMLPEGAEVMTNTSVTLDQAGISKAVNESGRYDAIRPKLMALYADPTKGREMRKIAAAPDFALGSVHAITEEGDVLVASASGSQLGPYPYSAGKVIWVAGTQKIVPNIDEGVRRIREYSYPLEEQRAQIAYGMSSMVAKILIVSGDRTPKRNTVVLIKQNIGF